MSDDEKTQEKLEEERLMKTMGRSSARKSAGKSPGAVPAWKQQQLRLEKEREERAKKVEEERAKASKAGKRAVIETSSQMEHQSAEEIAAHEEARLMKSLGSRGSRASREEKEQKAAAAASKKTASDASSGSSSVSGFSKDDRIKYRNEVIDALNNAREKPKLYVKALMKVKKCYQRLNFCPPSEPDVILPTTEGENGCKHAILHLSGKARARDPVTAAGGAALDHVAQALCGKLKNAPPNVNADGAPTDTAERLGSLLPADASCGGATRECVIVGACSAAEAVALLLIDDGNQSRSNRDALLDGKFKVAAVGTGPHSRYHRITVILLAESYSGDTESVAGDVDVDDQAIATPAAEKSEPKEQKAGDDGAVEAKKAEAKAKAEAEEKAKAKAAADQAAKEKAKAAEIDRQRKAKAEKEAAADKAKAAAEQQKRAQQEQAKKAEIDRRRKAAAERQKVEAESERKKAEEMASIIAKRREAEASAVSAEAEAKAKKDADEVRKAADDLAAAKQRAIKARSSEAERADRRKRLFSAAPAGEVKAKADSEAKAKAKAADADAAKAKAEAEAKAKAEAEAKAKADAEAQAKADAEAKAKAEAEALKKKEEEEEAAAAAAAAEEQKKAKEEEEEEEKAKKEQAKKEQDDHDQKKKAKKEAKKKAAAEAARAAEEAARKAAEAAAAAEESSSDDDSEVMVPEPTEKPVKLGPAKTAADIEAEQNPAALAKAAAEKAAGDKSNEKVSVLADSGDDYVISHDSNVSGGVDALSLSIRGDTLTLVEQDPESNAAKATRWQLPRVFQPSGVLATFDRAAGKLTVRLPKSAAVAVEGDGSFPEREVCSFSTKGRDSAPGESIKMDVDQTPTELIVHVNPSKSNEDVTVNYRTGGLEFTAKRIVQRVEASGKKVRVRKTVVETLRLPFVPKDITCKPKNSGADGMNIHIEKPARKLDKSKPEVIVPIQEK